MYIGFRCTRTRTHTRTDEPPRTRAAGPIRHRVAFR